MIKGISDDESITFKDEHKIKQKIYGEIVKLCLYAINKSKVCVSAEFLPVR